jgi:hypothetical protein
MWVRSPPAAPVIHAVPACEPGSTRASPCIPAARLGAAYSYLLGMYLGDGSLARHPRGVARLRITLDSRHAVAIAHCVACIHEVRQRQPGLVRRSGCVDVSSYWKHWPCVFPQHGPGPKHERSIPLDPWQQEIVERYAPEFLAGLLHSDGCRSINRVKGGAYPRYFFTNESDDIRRMFMMACDILGVEYRQNRSNCVSVARRESVKQVDDLIGPKL